MDCDGTNKTQLTTNPAYDLAPVWNPSGDKIAFISDRSGNDNIWVMDSDGSNKMQLTEGSNLYPAWSPDGTKISFVSVALSCSVQRHVAASFQQTGLFTSQRTGEMGCLLSVYTGQNKTGNMLMDITVRRRLITGFTNLMAA